MSSDDTVRAFPARSIETHSALTPDQADAVRALLAEAAVVDGQQPVSEQGRLQLRGGAREGVSHLLLCVDGELVGYAQLEDTGVAQQTAPGAAALGQSAQPGRGGCGLHGHGG
ncbi:mycothiol synthase, partial [Streptomyces sp. NPDC003233]